MKVLKMRAELRIAFLYALFGAAWIFLSDTLLNTWVSDPDVLNRIQTYKGWAFVAFSALVILLLLRRELKQRAITEEKLRQSETQYKQLFEHSLDAILLTSPDGRIHAANPAACRMLGRTEAEIIRLGRDGVVDAADPRLQAGLEERARTGSFHGELTYIRGDGTRFEGEVSTNIYKDSGGSERTSMIIRDITERRRMEASLKANEEFQRAIIACSPAAIFSIDLEGTVTTWNRSAERIFGWSAAEVIGRSLPTVPIDKRDEFAGLRQRVQDGETLSGVELVRQRKDGSLIHVSLSAAPLVGESSMGIMAIMEDITERKRSEEALHRSRERYRMISSLASDYMFQTRLDEQGRLHHEWVGGAFESITGYTLEEYILHGGWRASVHPDDLEIDDRDMQKLRDGRRVITEIRTITKSGGTRWVQVYAQPILDPESRRLIGIYGAVQEITERKKAEEALRESQERLKVILNNAPVVLLATDKDGVFTLSEGTGLKQSGLQPGQVVGMSAYDLYGELPITLPDGQGLSGKELLDRVFSGETVIASTEFNGVHFENRFAPLLDKNGDVNGMVGVSVDVTERKRAEEELRLSRDRLTELSRRLTRARESEARAIGRELHDQIGQMLTAMKITLDLVAQLPAETAAKKIDQARELTDDLLRRVSRLSLELRPPMLDDLGLLPALVWHVAQYQEGTGIRVDLEQHNVEGRRFPPEIETAAYRIVQEALTNAARHARARRVRLEVRAGDGWMGLFVEDDGAGFDAQAALSRNRGLGGMRERAQLVSGSFEIESEKDKGTKILIRLPLWEEAE